EKYFKFLIEYSDQYFKYGEVYENILGKDKTTIFIVLGLITVLVFKNSMEKMISFKPTYFNLLVSFIFIIYSIFQLNKISEFLYFNF
ncbi:MBOAT family protein, partial [Aliarcobacter butzleri]|nr:MBOAT family protein [Aliarcobacter butzleri]MDN5060196.1 MBOAT family protein [Aliarcobacter butzleri]MDN5110703.1 MBOAT family protein [Aliarcobacter butzleri]